MEPLLLAVARAAEILGLSEYSVRRAIAAGEMPYRRVGQAIRVTRTDIDEYLESVRVRAQRDTRSGLTPLSRARRQARSSRGALPIAR
ncbi:helix-turn-helix domain-containing protein [Cellulosimicrobium funkei]|uniref:helix-turn-helix domain-containing protein n=1 Tax=Cellulosimicrobium funkei TaxID=264251 RepID=UPI000397A41A